MKILELRFKNLNSLYGEWSIDFTDPEYVANGIFALTGPTGAGKSTILDAICLALYGATPRLGKITKSSNEIMSRQTGECYSEVTFESQEGVFRCHWTQHRARKKPEGNLIDARHEISDAVTGKPIETKKSLVSGVIEKKTGMDFDRFTRSILLAQGGFDTFLKADIEQKSKILEQITGTQIYTRISQAVHERLRDEREKLTILTAQTSEIRILTSDQKEEVKQQLGKEQKQEGFFAEQIDQAQKAIAWLVSLEELKKENISLTEKSDRLEIELKSFAPERERLNQAVKASGFDGEYATLAAMRKQQNEDQSVLNTQTCKLPELEALAAGKLEALSKLEKKRLKATENLNTAAPLIQKVRMLDQILKDKKQIVLDKETDYKKEVEQAQAEIKQQQTAQNKRKSAAKRLETIEEYLTVHSADEWLVSGLAGVKEQLNSLVLKQEKSSEKQNQKIQIKKTLKHVCQKLDDYTDQLNVHQQAMKDTKASIGQKKEQLSELLGDQLLREYRAQKEALLRESALRAKIIELETERSKLEDGKSCPLCGATEHPFAKGNIPVLDETEQKIETLGQLIEKAENLEQTIESIGEKEKEIQKQVAESEKLETAAVNEKQNLEKTLLVLEDALSEQQSGLSDLSKTILSSLKSLGITEIPALNLSEFVKSLDTRLKNWQDGIQEKNEIQKKWADLDNEVKQLDAVIETRNKIVAEKQTALSMAQTEYETDKTTRFNLFKISDPDDEEKRLNMAKQVAEQVEKEGRAEYSQAEQNLNSIKTNIDNLKDTINQRAKDLKQTESDFIHQLQRSGFKDEIAFSNARLSASGRDKIMAAAKKLDERKIDLASRQKDRRKRLNVEINKKMTDKTLKELEPEMEELEKSLKLHRKAIARLKHRLEEDAAAKKRIKEKQTEIEVQQKECARWENLHGLIGSADGKKYRNFAQGLTFELMVSHANQQLEKMTDRYLLIRDKDRPLELNVLDNYQAGEVRSTKNLSGGESFIVSLTLALGLSKMASRKVRVDSLFLDEGFGTLDEAALETALETLSALHQDGKLIGIISHVSALKERIATQINVEPLSGGQSGVTGPGCRKMIRET